MISTLNVQVVYQVMVLILIVVLAKRATIPWASVGPTQAAVASRSACPRVVHAKHWIKQIRGAARAWARVTRLPDLGATFGETTLCVSTETYRRFSLINFIQYIIDNNYILIYFIQFITYL